MKALISEDGKTLMGLEFGNFLDFSFCLCTLFFLSFLCVCVWLISKIIREKHEYTYFIARRGKMRGDLLVDAVDVLFLVGFLAGSGGGGILCRFRRHGREVVEYGRMRNAFKHSLSVVSMVM
jgi:hypothetical protein